MSQNTVPITVSDWMPAQVRTRRLGRLLGLGDPRWRQAGTWSGWAFTDAAAL